MQESTTEESEGPLDLDIFGDMQPNQVQLALADLVATQKWDALQKLIDRHHKLWRKNPVILASLLVQAEKAANIGNRELQGILDTQRNISIRNLEKLLTGFGRSTKKAYEILKPYVESMVLRDIRNDAVFKFYSNLKEHESLRGMNYLNPNLHQNDTPEKLVTYLLEAPEVAPHFLEKPEVQQQFLANPQLVAKMVLIGKQNLNATLEKTGLIEKFDIDNRRAFNNVTMIHTLLRGETILDGQALTDFKDRLNTLLNGSAENFHQSIDKLQKDVVAVERYWKATKNPLFKEKEAQPPLTLPAKNWRKSSHSDIPSIPEETKSPSTTSFATASDSSLSPTTSFATASSLSSKSNSSSPSSSPPQPKREKKVGVKPRQPPTRRHSLGN